MQLKCLLLENVFCAHVLSFFDKKSENSERRKKIGLTMMKDCFFRQKNVCINL